jgi:hypothetical protein
MTTRGMTILEKHGFAVKIELGAPTLDFGLRILDLGVAVGREPEPLGRGPGLNPKSYTERRFA